MSSRRYEDKVVELREALPGGVDGVLVTLERPVA